MPLTFAHPAAVLPFARNSKYVNFLAMVLGSMSPDFEYFLRGKPAGEIGHTLTGFFVYNLPIVVIVYIIYMTCIHRALFSHLPAFLQDTSSVKPQSTKRLKVSVFLYSALFGMLTHVVWDSFTHLNGFMVRNIALLTFPVDLFGFTIPVFKFLQHGSTILGITAIIIYMYVRATRNPSNNGIKINPNRKIKYWLQITVLTIVLFLLWYLVSQVSIQAYGVLVVRMIDSALLSLLIVSIYVQYYSRA